MDKQRTALQMWASALPREESRNMVFRYIELLDAVGGMYKVEESPGTVKAQMEVVGGRETRIEELTTKHDKLGKAKDALTAKYGPRCFQVMELEDEIGETKSRIYLTQQQLETAINGGLKASLVEYSDWIHRQAVQVQFSVVNLNLCLGHEESASGMENGCFEILSPVKERHEAGEGDGGVSGMNEREIAKLGQVSPDFGQSPETTLHGPPTPQSLTAKRIRVPSLFEKALALLKSGKVGEIGEIGESGESEKSENSDQPEEPETEAKEEPRKFPMNPKDIKARLNRLSLERKKESLSPGTKMAQARLEAEKINRTELHSEWANVALEEKKHRFFWNRSFDGW